MLPSQEDLATYAISTADQPDEAGAKIVYVPLNLITDEVTGERVAFSGRMIYQLQMVGPRPIRSGWLGSSRSSMTKSVTRQARTK